MTDREEGAGQRRYHHGELREALLAAAEMELSEKGEDGFSLRSTAKRAGVSHAAPAHHFKDVTALLQGLAQRGFERLTATMKEEQAEAGDDAEALYVASGVGYIRFAAENPALFQLMFGARSSHDKPTELAKAGDASFSVLVNAVARLRGADLLKTEEGWRDVAAAWMMVHGYAHLAIGGKVGWLTGQSFDRQRPVIADLVRRALRL
ncbi:MAG: TetR/AcrR family transcriptional regulator [Roseitalea sp.]|jgi:AcrR family transcriptional regulator|nr:TetR/AcrR family transcriptional regulator [Roseitalea sp.]MBO6722432.1 TetR/AcrR family transcriptional regulator [Roseitalea sp.]MBO6741954.1 TetR/AcrR family transcriptional regulator [Roseitalea sp.]